MDFQKGKPVQRRGCPDGGILVVREASKRGSALATRRRDEIGDVLGMTTPPSRPGKSNHQLRGKCRLKCFYPSFRP